MLVASSKTVNVSTVQYLLWAMNNDTMSMLNISDILFLLVLTSAHQWGDLTIIILCVGLHTVKLRDKYYSQTSKETGGGKQGP